MKGCRVMIMGGCFGAFDNNNLIVTINIQLENRRKRKIHKKLNYVNELCMQSINLSFGVIAYDNVSQGFNSSTVTTRIWSETLHCLKFRLSISTSNKIVEDIVVKAIRHRHMLLRSCIDFRWIVTWWHFASLSSSGKSFKIYVIKLFLTHFRCTISLHTVITTAQTIVWN